VTFRQGFVSGRITPLKTESSRAEMSIPQEVKEALPEWKKHTPYSAPENWVFASPPTKGGRPFWPDSILANYIQPIAEGAGFGRVGWHTFRHSVSQWSKQALKLEETKAILRHGSYKTSSDIYKRLPLDAKRNAQARLVEFVHQKAKKPSETRASA
jgi:integrase